MTQTTSAAVVFAFCVILGPSVSVKAYNDDCDSFPDCLEDLCCSDSYMATRTPLILGITGFIVVVLIFICCCVCPCCCLYRMCRRPQPVIATTTHTTVVTRTPQRYPQQPVASPSHQYQPGPYPAYQPVPVQPSFAAQPVPQGYGTQAPSAVPYPSFMPGPPPSYQEAIGPVVPPGAAPYSQAAFAPHQPAYPLNPPAQPQANAPPAQPDYLAQPAYNPDFVGMPTKTG